MNDRLVEFLHCCDVWIYMQGVNVPTQTVDEGLAGEGSGLQNVVRISAEYLRDQGEQALAFVAEAAQAPEKHGHVVLEGELLLVILADHIRIDPE